METKINITNLQVADQRLNEVVDQLKGLMKAALDDEIACGKAIATLQVRKDCYNNISSSL